MLCSLLLGVFVIMRPFFISLLWAAVLTVTLWPLNIYFRKKFTRWPETLAASITTLMLCLLVLGIVVPFSFELASDIKHLLISIRESPEESTAMFSSLSVHFSWLVEYLKPLLEESINAKREALRLLEQYQPEMVSVVTFAARGIWGVLFNLGVTIFSSYFFFRYGDVLAQQLLVVAHHLGGVRYVDLVKTVWKSTQGVVYGVAGAAICQGTLAGLGYYMFGAPLPLVLGALTIVLGLIPFGPPLLYLPVALSMFLSGSSLISVLSLLAWGIAVVSTVDNLFRPLFIYHSTKLPILLAFFGGLGGISAFGMVGLFVGPVILVLAQTIWLSSVESGVSKDIQANTATVTDLAR
jgi:predicted PurR-regulated permease PerM